MTQPHAALILGAGGSRRLGQPKQLLTRDRESLLRRAARLALATSPRRCLVVVGAQAESARAVLDGLPVEIVGHPQWVQGMGSSLAALRDALGEDPAVARSLILGCDQPALEAAHLHALLEAAERAASGCAVSGYAGVRGIPVVVAQSQWRHASLAGDRGLRTLFEKLGWDTVGCVVAPTLALDVDTAEDVAAAQARGWLDPPA